MLWWAKKADGVDCKDGAVFDPVWRVWEPLPAEMAVGRADYSAVVVARGMLISGGSDDPVADELFDKSSGRWFPLPHPPAMYHHGGGPMVRLPCIHE